MLQDGHERLTDRQADRQTDGQTNFVVCVCVCGGGGGGGGYKEAKKTCRILINNNDISGKQNLGRQWSHTLGTSAVTMLIMPTEHVSAETQW